MLCSFETSKLTGQVSGVECVRDLCIWRLNQTKTLASASIVVEYQSFSEFPQIARTINECLHAYGIDSATLQPLTPATAYFATNKSQGSQELEYLPKQPLETCQSV